MRFIGGKSLLTDEIYNVIRENAPDAETITDVFAGSGAVSLAIKKRNFRVISNDFLYFSYVLSRATISLNKTPTFDGLDLPNIIDFLNTAPTDKLNYNRQTAFVYNNYSPGNGSERMYFQPENALRIDAVRQQIQTWYKAGNINENEYFYLLATLIASIPYVANITGIFAAYLKYWDARTYKKLELRPLEIYDNHKKNICFNKDFSEILPCKTDVLYADPPYNSREYLPNYHILETVAKYDNPTITGITGMRDYSGQKSMFCKKNTVVDAFLYLLKNANARYIMISYNNEGLISTEQLTDLCKMYAANGSFKLFEFPYRRYKNKIPNNKKGLREQIYFLQKRTQ